MAQGSRNIAAAVADDAGFTDSDGFGFELAHPARLAKQGFPRNGSDIIEFNDPGVGLLTELILSVGERLLIHQSRSKSAAIIAWRLVGADVQSASDIKPEDAIGGDNAVIWRRTRLVKRAVGSDRKVGYRH